MALKTLQVAPDLAQRCYEALIESISSGDMVVGRKYTQEELAASLGVSRQPVLQALQTLKRQGLITESDNRRGVQVAPLDATFVQNLYQVRAALDGAASRAAAMLPRPELREPGMRLIRAGRAASARRDLKALVRADMDFHAFLYDASHNPLLVQTATVHWHHTRRLMTAYLQHGVSLRSVWAEHQAMLAAVVKGDSRAAERLARDHCESAERLVLRLLFRQDERVVAAAETA
ncbi:MAG: GntR family transcriptional regulator [Burkholderiaceae bacterium]